jgi:hypothetical protein
MPNHGFTSYKVWGVQERIFGDSTAAGEAAGFVYNCAMALSIRKLASNSPWVAELLVAGVGLVLGVTLMPVLIFYAGVAALGRFDGASLGRLYASLFEGLREASIASWVVLLGPYGLYLLFRVLRAWWRASARLR